MGRRCLGVSGSGFGLFLKLCKQIPPHLQFHLFYSFQEEKLNSRPREYLQGVTDDDHDHDDNSDDDCAAD